jgi:hypothetical protein
VTDGTTTEKRTAGTHARIASGLLVALAAGAVATASGWGLLQWWQRDLLHHLAEVTGITTAPWVEPHDAAAFGGQVAGLALLSWLLASRPGAAILRSLVHTGGPLVAWTVAAWLLVPSVASLWWPGPVPPALLDAHGQVARSAAPAAYLGPLVSLVAIAASVAVASRRTTREGFVDESAGSKPPSRAASRVASGLVGAGTLVGLAGVAALVLAGWSSGTWAWSDLDALADRPFVLAAAVACVAWRVSGAAHGNAILVLVAAVAVLSGDLATASPYLAGAALLGIATASVASAHRPLATALDRLRL